MHEFSGLFSEDTGRIGLKREYREEMLSILQKGGKISFSISDDHVSGTKYVFSIQNADEFDAQWRMAAGFAIGYMSGVHEGIAAVMSNGKMGGH